MSAQLFEIVDCASESDVIGTSRRRFTSAALMKQDDAPASLSEDFRDWCHVDGIHSRAAGEKNDRFSRVGTEFIKG